MINDPSSDELNRRLALESQMIDQLTFILGCVQLVLLRYPRDFFLKGHLERVLSAADRLTELVRQETWHTPTSDT